MSQLTIPAGYTPALDIRQTAVAIKQIKDFFERELAKELNLTRISAPLFVRPESGLNDNLNGIERPVAFGVKDMGEAQAEIVQSLAKWKRMALARYHFEPGEGIYTDMNAIRRDEDLDNIHSIYVDQWDWERIITPQERSVQVLEAIVRGVFAALKRTEHYIRGIYDYIQEQLPQEITFVTSQALEDRFPELTPKQREYAIAREHGAVFIIGIGGALRSGIQHDGRAPDYDDWTLNGDILVYYPVLDIALELSSMGIRVDAQRLAKQLEIRGCQERSQLPFQRALLDGKLPQTIGGGIGQSRMCMFFLQKAHVGEVQASIWPDDMWSACQAAEVALL